MKILQLIPNLSGGGAERFVVDLCNELAKEYEVYLITLYDPCEQDLFRKDLAPDIKTYGLGKKIGFNVKIAFRLYKVIKQINPNVIHNHLRSLNYLLPLIPLLRPIPIVHTIHNDAYRECPSGKQRTLRSYFFRRGWLSAVTISDESETSFNKAYKGIKSRLIYNGRQFPEKSNAYHSTKAEIERYKFNADTKIFLNIGRIISQKNQILLMKAFNRFRQDYPNTLLFIIGGGRCTDDSQKIQLEIKRTQGNKAGTYWLGERYNATDYLYLADFFCLSSIYEGMPVTLIESFAIGTIPVCTAVGGMTEMISGLDKSLLADEISEKAYYKALKRAYELPGTRQKKLKDKAKGLFDKKYSIEYCAKKHVELYKGF